MIANALNGGAEQDPEDDFLETTLGQTLIKPSNTGSIVPYHNPDPIAKGLVEDPLGDDPFEQEKNKGNLGGEWYDPMGGSMLEQMIKNGKKKGKDDKGSGDAGSDAHNPGEQFPGPPELVNPVPEMHLQAYPDIPNLQSLAGTLRPRAMALQPMAPQTLRSAATARIAK